MSAVPLAVRLKTFRADRRVATRSQGISGLRKVAPGGFASCSITLEKPLRITPDEVGAFGKLYIYDRRNAQTVWEGRVEDLGKNADENGQIWELSAVGPSAHAQDKMQALFYIDTRLDAIKRGAGSYKATDIALDETPDGDPGIKQQFGRGIGVTTANEKAISYYDEIRGAGLKLAVIRFQIYAGLTNSTSWRGRGWVSPTPGTYTMVYDTGLTAGAMGAGNRFVGTDWSSGEDQVTFEFQWIAGTNGTIGNDSSWIMWHDLAIQQVRKNASGTDLLTAASYTGGQYIYADVAISDLLGRMLPLYDGANASIDTSSVYTIEQLAYPDGTTADQVLSDIMAMIGTHLWEALESNPATGKYKFNWRPWPTVVRYDATLADGYQSPISAGDLYNECLVRWKDNRGRIRTTKVTQTVQILTDAGLTRTGFVDISDTTGTINNATQAGTSFLGSHATISNIGTLSIQRPILDRLYGRYVQPWEIMPGYLVRVRGVQPEIDFLNQALNGTTVCRIVSTEYNDNNNTATLELDEYSVDVQRQITSLQKSIANRRRR